MSKEYMFLNTKEEKVMNVLWAATKPLSATEVANAIPNCNWSPTSVRNVLDSLREKEVIEVAEIAKISKTYGRLFRAIISSNDYIANQIDRFCSKDKHYSFISSLIEQQDNEDEIIKILKELLKKYENR